MAATPQYSAQGAAAPPARAQALNPKQLALASLSSVFGGVLGAAFRGAAVMTFAGMAVAPWLTAFVEHPGPHHRRLVALLAFVGVRVSQGPCLGAGAAYERPLGRGRPASCAALR